MCVVNIRVAAQTDLPFLRENDSHIADEELVSVVQRGRILVAEDSDNPIGWLRWGLFWDEIPFMNMLTVLSSNRGQGIGRALVTDWEKRMSRAGHSQVLTSTELPTYTRWPITVVRGEGSTVWDENGKAYLDLYGGHAVASTGHCHPEVARAIAEQAKKLLFYSNVVAVPVRTRASDAVARHAPPSLGNLVGEHVAIRRCGGERDHLDHRLRAVDELARTSRAIAWRPSATLPRRRRSSTTASRPFSSSRSRASPEW